MGTNSPETSRYASSPDWPENKLKTEKTFININKKLPEAVECANNPILPVRGVQTG